MINANSELDFLYRGLRALVGFRARAAREKERDNPEHHGACRHENGAQANFGGFLDGFAFVAPFLLQVIGELHDENAVLADKPH